MVENDDVLWGAVQIARYVNRTPRQVYYLLQRGKLPHTKLGPKTICASRAALDEALGRRPQPQRVRAKQEG
jgi:excisionase family DNA binding protein